MPDWNLIVAFAMAVVAFCLGLGHALRAHRPGKRRDGGARRPRLTDLAGITKERANSADQPVRQVADFAGPPVTGVLISVVGAPGVLWLNASTFAVSETVAFLGVPRSRLLVADDVALLIGEERTAAHVQDHQSVAPRVLHDRASTDLYVEGRLDHLSSRPLDGV